MKFCKLFDVDDEQILITLERTNEIHVRMQFNGVVAKVSVRFETEGKQLRALAEFTENDAKIVRETTKPFFDI